MKSRKAEHTAVSYDMVKSGSSVMNVKCRAETALERINRRNLIVWRLLPV